MGRVMGVRIKVLNVSIGSMWGAPVVEVPREDPRCPCCVEREGPATPLGLRFVSGNVNLKEVVQLSAGLRFLYIPWYGQCYACSVFCESCGDPYIIVVER